jgi:hypothetical protein
MGGPAILQGGPQASSALSSSTLIADVRIFENYVSHPQLHIPQSHPTLSFHLLILWHHPTT